MLNGAGQSASELMENSVDLLFSSDIDKANNSIDVKMEMKKALRAINKKLVTMDSTDAIDLQMYWIVLIV